MLKHKLPPKQEKIEQDQKIWWWLSSGLMVLVLSGVGLLGFTPQGQEFTKIWRGNYRQQQKYESSNILPLVSKPPQQRAELLATIANSKKPSLDRHRARYLLAVDLLKQNQGIAALEYLRGLEQDYSLLAPHILFKTAQAYQQTNQQTKAKNIAEKLKAEYPKSPLVVDVFYLLNPAQSKFDRDLWGQFPHHPLIQKLAREVLINQPDKLDFLLWLAKYSRDNDLNPIRDRLVLDYPSELKPEDWEAIADGYWRSKEYRKAADAYRFTRLTPGNLYRTARGFHLNGNLSDARRWYQKLISEFHDARETGLALQYLARISSGQEALIYLDLVINKFSDRAPYALLAQAVIYDALRQPQLAEASRNRLLQEYPQSEAAVIYRWQVAQKLAKGGNTEQAWQWIEPVIALNLHLDILPKATFWAGKWATQLGKLDSAKEAFEHTITHYPQSYYAWRSALALGWDVGSFTNADKLNPSLEFPVANSPLPVGSEVLKELFILGHYQDAWTILQSEIVNPQELSVNEQFIEGLLLVRLGATSAGIQNIWDLARREEHHERQQWQLLRKTPLYWYGLFPFPYKQAIISNAQQQNINPLLVVSIMRKESSFAPAIESRAGAVGLMQIVPNTAQWVAQKIDLTDYSLRKPEDNIKIGTWYIAHNHQRYDHNSLVAIASYNAGTGNVSQWLKKI